MARILVTGSSGFLGEALCERLSSLGHSVDGIDILPGKFTNIQKDVREVCGTYDVVYHFAASVGGREGIENNFLTVAANIELDRIVFDYLLKNPVVKFVYPSSSAVYPVTKQTDRHTALSEYMIDFDTDTIGVSDHLYGWSKLTAERMLWELNKRIDTQISIVRPFSGYGPGQSTDYPVPNLINIVKNNPDDLQVWGTGEQTRDFVYIDDVVDTLVWCIADDTKYRTINIGTGIATSFNKLITIAHKLVHGTAPAHIEKLTHKPVGVSNRYCDPRLQQQLGIYPKTTLEEGIKKFL